MSVMHDDSDGCSEDTDFSDVNYALQSINGDVYKIMSNNTFLEMFHLNKDLINKTTSTISNSTINYDSSKQEIMKKKTEHDLALENGFSFGREFTFYEPTSAGYNDEENDSNDAVEEIYGTEMKELSIFKSGGEDNSENRVLPQRIGKVGYIGQKISPGHIFGALLIEASELRPKPIEVEVAEYVIDEDSPVQIDIKWNKPENADKFKTLTYNVQMKPKSGDKCWIFICSVKYPVFRVYHTDDKLLLGKVHLSRQSSDLAYVLRCQVQGEIFHNNMSHLLYGDWSSDISLIFRGYQSEH